MNLGQELFEAILQNPDDLAPRLVYADWCDDEGDPRGEFIRIQCELAADQGETVNVRHLQEREAKLWEQNRRAWNAETHRRLAATPLQNRVHSRRGLIRGWKYHRGFVEYAVVEAGAFLDYPEALFQIGPLKRVRILRAQNLLSRIQHSPYLPRLETVEIPIAREPPPRVTRSFGLWHPVRAARLEVPPANSPPATTRLAPDLNRQTRTPPVPADEPGLFWTLAAFCMMGGSAVGLYFGMVSLATLLILLALNLAEFFGL
jgi:uncharacterized protein (TIGR02996 family)